VISHVDGATVKVQKKTVKMKEIKNIYKNLIKTQPIKSHFNSISNFLQQQTFNKQLTQ
jgi:hypothetical protein